MSSTYDSLQNQVARQTAFCEKQGHLIGSLFLKTGQEENVYCETCGVRVTLRITNLYRDNWERK